MLVDLTTVFAAGCDAAELFAPRTTRLAMAGFGYFAVTV